MDFSKLAESIKNIFKELENIKSCYFLAYFIFYISILLLPENLSNKFGSLKYINILSLLFIFSLVVLTGRIINYISLRIDRFFYERNGLKYLDTLNRNEERVFYVAVERNQQTIYMNFEDSAGISLLHKNLIIKCFSSEKQHPDKMWAYIIPGFVWNKIKKWDSHAELVSAYDQ